MDGRIEYDWMSVAADRANAILREFFEKAPEVVCRNSDGKWSCDEHKGFARASHVGRLVFVEGIEKGLNADTACRIAEERRGKVGSKLTRDGAKQIRHLHSKGESQKDLAAVFGVSLDLVSLICAGKIWK